MLCKLCPRECGARRDANIGEGFCKMPLMPVVARTQLHFWEEPSISGTKGTGAVFFSGCSLKCCFCQNSDISFGTAGEQTDAHGLVEIFKQLESEGTHTLDLVNPTHFIPEIRKALLLYKPKIPVIYNSSGYDSVEALKSMEGLIDVYLPDLKYFSPQKSERYARCPDYFEKASKAVLEMHRQQPETVFENGIIKKGLIIRHLCLPSNAIESKCILKWIKNNLPSTVYVSLMSQYTPHFKAGEYPEIRDRLTEAQYKSIVDYFFSLGLTNGYMQDLSSAGEEYIPPFKK